MLDGHVEGGETPWECTAREVPVPAAEVYALILLSPAEIRALIREASSLERFLENGGKARFKPCRTFGRALPLRPSSDWAAFVQIAAEHPEIMR